MGQAFDSKAEARRAAELELLRLAGKIHRWERGTPQVLVEGPTRRRRITYKPDFIVWDNEWHCHAEDVKGAVPRDFRLRAILWEQKFPRIPLQVIDSRGQVVWSLDDPPRKKRAAA